MRNKPKFNQWVTLHTDDRVMIETYAFGLGGTVSDILQYHAEYVTYSFQFNTSGARTLFTKWLRQVTRRKE